MNDCMICLMPGATRVCKCSFMHRECAMLFVKRMGNQCRICRTLVRWKHFHVTFYIINWCQAVTASANELELTLPADRHIIATIMSNRQLKEKIAQKMPDDLWGDPCAFIEAAVLNNPFLMHLLLSELDSRGKNAPAPSLATAQT